MLNPAVSCGTAPVRKAGPGQGCGAAASGAGQRRVGGSNPARAGSIPGHYCWVTGYGACSGVGRKGVAAVPWGGLVYGEQVERPGLGKMKASAGCGERQLLTPFFFSPSKTCVSLGIVPALSTTVGSKSNLQVYN